MAWGDTDRWRSLGGLAPLVALAGCAAGVGSATVSTEAHRVNPLAIHEVAGFEDVTDRSGIQFEHVPPDLEGPRAHYMLAATSGVAAADLDGDGAIDLFFTQVSGPNSLYWGRSDVRWLPAELPSFMALDDLACSATTAVDFDGDGRLDLSVMAPGVLRLFRNLGDRAFEDVTDAVGLTGGAGFGSTLAWADIDGDGDLDRYAGRHWRPARMTSSRGRSLTASGETKGGSSWTPRRPSDWGATTARCCTLSGRTSTRTGTSTCCR